MQKILTFSYTFISMFKKKNLDCFIIIIIQFFYSIDLWLKFNNYVRDHFLF